MKDEKIEDGERGMKWVGEEEGWMKELGQEEGRMN